MKTISKKEVLLHNTPSDCWVIIFNDVYDLTPFVEKHPGGSRIILTRAGEDATSYFQTKHWGDEKIKKYLQKFLIGTLPEEERIKEEHMNEPFLKELVELCHKNNLYKIDKRTALKFGVIRAALLLSFFGTLLYGFVFSEFKIASIVAAIIQGMIATSLFGLIAHESTHRNYPKGKVSQFLLKIFGPILWPFISMEALEFEHNNHHIKIGDPEYDFEVAGFAPYVRYSGAIELNNNHKRQQFAAKFLYPFYANIITTIGAAKSNYWSSHNRNLNKKHTLSIIWTFVFYLGLPLLFGINIFWSLFLYLIFQCVLYFGVYIGSAVNHFVPPIIEEIPLEHKNKCGYYACHNTADFCSNSTFWFFYTGGFNIQIEHHLIAFIPAENLKKMAVIVRELCKKYNYPYRNYSSVRDLWNAHYEYLKIMSSDNELVEKELLNKQQYQAR